MPNTSSEQIRECLSHAEECARKAAAQTNPTLQQDFLDVERRWLALARSYESSLADFVDLPTRTQLLIDESRLLRVLVRRKGAVLKELDAELLANSRAKIVESKRLLATVDRPTAIARGDRAHVEAGTIPIAPTELPLLEEVHHNPATLTMNVFQEERVLWLDRSQARDQRVARARSGPN